MLMLIVLFIIGIILLITGVIFNKSHSYYGSYGFSFSLVGVIITLVTFVIILIFGISLSNKVIIDEKIALYQEENQNIETQINTTVESYKQFEQDTYKNFKSDSVITLVTLFPELKTDEIVKKQIDLYIANNQVIKSLKEKKLNYRPMAWWLYFGKQ